MEKEKNKQYKENKKAKFNKQKNKNKRNFIRKIRKIQ